MKKVFVVLTITFFFISSCSAKPSRGEVEDSFTKIYIENLGPHATAEEKVHVKKLSECIFDKAYDDLSVDTLNNFVDADSVEDFEDVKGSDDEVRAFQKALLSCSKKISSK